MCQYRQAKRQFRRVIVFRFHSLTRQPGRSWDCRSRIEHWDCPCPGSRGKRGKWRRKRCRHQRCRPGRRGETGLPGGFRNNHNLAVHTAPDHTNFASVLSPQVSRALGEWDSVGDDDRGDIDNDDVDDDDSASQAWQPNQDGDGPPRLPRDEVDYPALKAEWREVDTLATAFNAKLENAANGGNALADVTARLLQDEDGSDGAGLSALSDKFHPDVRRRERERQRQVEDYQEPSMQNPTVWFDWLDRRLGTMLEHLDMNCDGTTARAFLGERSAGTSSSNLRKMGRHLMVAGQDNVSDDAGGGTGTGSGSADGRVSDVSDIGTAGNDSARTGDVPVPAPVGGEGNGGGGGLANNDAQVHEGDDPKVFALDRTPHGESSHAESTTSSVGDASASAAGAANGRKSLIHASGHILNKRFSPGEDTPMSELTNLSKQLVNIGCAKECDYKRLKTGDLTFGIFQKTFDMLNRANFPETARYKEVLGANGLSVDDFSSINTAEVFWGDHNTNEFYKNIMVWWKAMFFGSAEEGTTRFDGDSTLLTRCYPREKSSNKGQFDEEWKKAKKDKKLKAKAEKKKRGQAKKKRYHTNKDKEKEIKEERDAEEKKKVSANEEREARRKNRSK